MIIFLIMSNLLGNSIVCLTATLSMVFLHLKKLKSILWKRWIELNNFWTIGTKTKPRLYMVARKRITDQKPTKFIFRTGKNSFQCKSFIQQHCTNLDTLRDTKADLIEILKIYLERLTMLWKNLGQRLLLCLSSKTWKYK